MVVDRHGTGKITLTSAVYKQTYKYWSFPKN